MTEAGAVTQKAALLTVRPSQPVAAPVTRPQHKCAKHASKTATAAQARGQATPSLPTRHDTPAPPPRFQAPAAPARTAPVATIQAQLRKLSTEPDVDDDDTGSQPPAAELLSSEPENDDDDDDPLDYDSEGARQTVVLASSNKRALPASPPTRAPKRVEHTASAAQRQLSIRRFAAEPATTTTTSSKFLPRAIVTVPVALGQPARQEALDQAMIATRITASFRGMYQRIEALKESVEQVAQLFAENF